MKETRQEAKDTIIMYTTCWCPGCHRAKYFLDEHGISYEEIDVEEDEEAMAFVKAVNRGVRVVPTIVFPDGQVLVEPPNAALAAKLGIEPLEDSLPRL